MSNLEAQKIADTIGAWKGVEEVVWLKVVERIAEFYIIMESEAAAHLHRHRVQSMVNDIEEPIRFSMMPKAALSWGYAGTKN